ncbi:helix-turn-helix domain-containing protein [Nocardioides bruguierae]|uniref:Helix-turn-helix domain-containing protein n=1 Tax=Nocardioides bruguierae TaxID=2945102 RepID=A0A9X2D7M1_9ACTN|nr:helix-turn-helix domain-containing protein [Nocardioides bruguierae]MCM0620878.1 helix-turn-helix domain-containing protein [Nocardioides bruguierae]
MEAAQIWDTADRPHADRFGYWHDALCQAFVPLVPQLTHSAGTFSGRVERRVVGDLDLAVLGSSGQRVAHGPRQVASTEGEHFFVNLQLLGTCESEQDGSRSVTSPGLAAVVDTTRPYHLAQEEEWRTLSFKVPRERLEEQLASRPPALARALRSPSTADVLRTLMTALWDCDPDSPAVPGLTDAFCASVAAAMLDAQPPPPSSRDARRALVLRHVQARVGDPGLSVASVCRDLGFSPRTLHAAFDGSGESFARAVRRVRLERAARLLAHPRTLTVTRVAGAVGFVDTSAFSRAYRRERGETPSQTQARARTAREQRTQ